MDGDTFTLSELERDAASVQRAAARGPVFIVQGEARSLVVLSVEDYERLSRRPMSIAESLADRYAPDVELEIPERRIEPFREIDW